MSRQADPESQRSDVSELANDLAEAIYYEMLEEAYQDKSCYHTPRKNQVEVCRTDVQRNYETFFSIFTFSAKRQNYHLEPKNYELEMKIKKYSYIKDGKEQPREICDKYVKKSLKCNTQGRLVRTYELATSSR